MILLTFIRILNIPNLEYDLFVAISHGQNRGILKKGKVDDREKLLKIFIKKFAKY